MACNLLAILWCTFRNLHAKNMESIIIVWLNKTTLCPIRLIVCPEVRNNIFFLVIEYSSSCFWWLFSASVAAELTETSILWWSKFLPSTGWQQSCGLAMKWDVAMVYYDKTFFLQFNRFIVLFYCVMFSHPSDVAPSFTNMITTIPVLADSRSFEKHKLSKHSCFVSSYIQLLVQNFIMLLPSFSWQISAWKHGLQLDRHQLLFLL